MARRWRSGRCSSRSAMAGAPGRAGAVGEDPAAEVDRGAPKPGAAGAGVGSPRRRRGISRGGLDAAQRDRGHALPGHARPSSRSSSGSGRARGRPPPSTSPPWHGSRRRSPPTRAGSIARRRRRSAGARPGRGAAPRGGSAGRQAAPLPPSLASSGPAVAHGAVRRVPGGPAAPERRPRGARRRPRTRGARRRTRPGSSRSPWCRRATGWLSRSASRRTRRRSSGPQPKTPADQPHPALPPACDRVPRRRRSSG